MNRGRGSLAAMRSEYTNPGNFSAEEIVFSDAAVRHGISNEPSPGQWGVLSKGAAQILQPLRNMLGPIRVLSGYRCPEINRIVGGSKMSDHMVIHPAGRPLGPACAFDIWPLEVPLHTLALCVLDQMPFHKLIWEYGGRWVHVSYWWGEPGRLIYNAVRETDPETGKGWTDYRAMSPGSFRAMIEEDRR